MKRLIFFCLFCFSLAALFCSCRSKAPISLPEAEYTLAIVEEYCKLDGNSVKLMYPSISGYNNQETENALNHKAAELARQAYAREGLIANEEGGYSYTATDAVVTLTSRDFFSVCIAGTVTSEVSGTSSYFAYSMNCDLADASFLSTEDMVTDYPELKKLFIEGEFQADFGYDGQDGSMSLETLISQYKEAYGIYPYLYFRQGKLGILVETLPTLGGYAGFLMDVKRAAPYLNTQKESIAVLCGIQ